MAPFGFETEYDAGPPSIDGEHSLPKKQAAFIPPFPALRNGVTISPNREDFYGETAFSASAKRCHFSISNFTHRDISARYIIDALTERGFATEDENPFYKWGGAVYARGDEHLRFSASYSENRDTVFLKIR